MEYPTPVGISAHLCRHTPLTPVPYRSIDKPLYTPIPMSALPTVVENLCQYSIASWLYSEGGMEGRWCGVRLFLRICTKVLGTPL